MKTLHLFIITGIIASAIMASFFILSAIQNEPIQAQICQGSQSDNCIYSFGMEVDNESRNYDAFPIHEENKPIEFDGVRFAYTGSSTPDIDGINCDNVFPRAMNSTTGHHPPIIVIYGGYFKINETRHFTATFEDGQTKSLTLCWNSMASPKVIQMSDSGLGGPMFCPSKISWFDDNKTAGIIQDEYCSPNSPDYDRYIAETR